MSRGVEDFTLLEKDLNSEPKFKVETKNDIFFMINRGKQTIINCKKLIFKPDTAYISTHQSYVLVKPKRFSIIGMHYSDNESHLSDLERQKQ